MKKYRLRLELLSPIHIGAGTEMNPLDYIIEDGRLYSISFEKFVVGMDNAQRRELENLIDMSSLMEMRKYVLRNINKERDCIYSIEVSSKVETIYKSKLGDIQNQLLVYPFVRTEGEVVPLMPGSSVKGAVRTAVISDHAKKINLPKPRDAKDEYAFESMVLGYKDAKDDPFRGVTIRDKSLKNDDMIVRDVRNVSKKKNGSLEANDLQIFCEVSHSAISGKPVIIDTELLIDKELFCTNFPSKTLTIEQLIKSCTAFYREKMESEHKKFYKSSQVEKVSVQLLDTALDKNSFILRIGRFSGVESVTLDGYRNPRPPGYKGVWGTSRNIAEGTYPMGWVKVTVSE
jgi:CRISPR-associated protein Csm5